MRAAPPRLTYLLFAPGTSLGARTRAAHDYADRFFEPRDHVVGVTGSAPARDEQGDIISDSLPTVELATLVAIMLIVGLSFRSLVTPVVTVMTAGVAYVATFRVSGLLTKLLDLPSPDELKPVVVALLLGVVTDYVVFFCAALRDERLAASACASGVDASDRTIRTDRRRGGCRRRRRNSHPARRRVALLPRPRTCLGLHDHRRAAGGGHPGARADRCPRGSGLLAGTQAVPRRPA